MSEAEITQLVQTQTELIASLCAAVTDMQGRLAPVLQPGIPPEQIPPYPDPSDSPISAALKLNNFNIAASSLYLRDLLARLEL